MSRLHGVREIGISIAWVVTGTLVLSCQPADDTAVASSAVTLPVTVTNAMYKIQKTNPDPYHAFPGGSAAISAAKNEFEAFQIVIPGVASNVNATAGDLTCPSGACAGAHITAATCSGGVGAAGNVRLYRERYYDPTISSANWSDTHSMLGTLPDALIPQVDELYNECRAFTFNVASGNNGVIWVDIYVPPTQLAGSYTGNITVTSDQGTATVPVMLEVWDFALPATATLHSTFGMSGVAMRTQHAVGAICDPSIARLHRLYGAVGLDHRITLNVLDDECNNTASYIASTYAPLFDGTLTTAPELTRLAGARTTSIQYLQGLTDSAALASWASTMHAHTGWFQQLFQYTADEPGGAGFSNIAPAAIAAHTADPSFRTLVTTDLDEAYAAGVNYNRDINRFVEIIDHLEGTAGNERYEYTDYPQGSGASWEASNPINELWTYQSCDSHGCGNFAGPDRWPSYMIDARPMRNRALEWFSFKNKVKGELYFDVNFAWNGGEWTNQFYFSGHGDGTLLYPGTPTAVSGGSTEAIGGTHHIPISSIRFQLIREGMEDYEYMALLESQGARTFVESEIAAVFPNGAVNTEGDPEVLYAKRQEMACRILANLGKTCPVGGGSPSPLFNDTFDRTTGLGTSWDVTAGGSYTTDGAHAVSTSAQNWARVVPSLGTNDYKVTAELTVPAGSLFSGIIARSATINTDETMYAAQLATDGHVNLYRRNAYTWTLLAASTTTITAGVAYTVELAVSGSNPVHLEVWLNGTQKISFDDSSASRITAGVPGIENYDSGVAYNSFRVDP
jgi:glycosyl hydrolase family 123